MLTLVACSFYNSAYLPRLPYNTFSQSTIIANYIIIFVLIAAILIRRVLMAHNKQKGGSAAEYIMKWDMPAFNLIAWGWPGFYFFGSSGLLFDCS